MMLFSILFHIIKTKNYFNLLYLEQTPPFFFFFFNHIGEDNHFPFLETHL